MERGLELVTREHPHVALGVGAGNFGMNWERGESQDEHFEQNPKHLDITQAIALSWRTRTRAADGIQGAQGS